GSDPQPKEQRTAEPMPGIGSNRGHARVRVWNTSVKTALACRVHLHSDRAVKSRWFLTPETFPSGTPPAQVAPQVVVSLSAWPRGGECGQGAPAQSRRLAAHGGREELAATL